MADIEQVSSQYPAPYASNAGLGYRVGKYLQEKWLGVVLIGLLCFVAYVIFTTMSECQANDASIGRTIVHYGCKSKGGCGGGCPYSNPNDPRVALVRHMETSKAIATIVDRSYGETQQSTLDTLSHFNATNRDRIAKSISGPLNTMSICVSNIFPLVTKIEDLVAMFSKRDKTSTEVYDAQNRGAALEAAVMINLRVYAIADMKIDSIIKDYRLTQLSEYEKSKVSNFDEEYTKVLTSVTAINKAYEKCLIYIATDADVLNNYSDVTRAVLSTDTNYDVVVAAMARGLNLAQDVSTIEQSARIQYEVILDIFHRAVEKFEGFSNSMPGVVATNEINSLIVGGDYGTALIKTALEPDMVKNHHKFASERMTFDSGGGPASVRDDDNDLIPWVGIFGRPSYRKSDGTSVEVSGEPLRSISSVGPETLMRKSVPRLTFP